jgi:hypothetical protein
MTWPTFFLLQLYNGWCYQSKTLHKIWPLEMWIPFKGLHSTHGVTMMCLFKHFLSLRCCFLKVEIKPCSQILGFYGLPFHRASILSECAQHNHPCQLHNKFSILLWQHSPHKFTINYLSNT